MSADLGRALQLAAAGRWDEAHELVRPRFDTLACLVHAYLHRVEGDLSNAAYWYRRAGEKMPDNSLDQELIRFAQPGYRQRKVKVTGPSLTRDTFMSAPNSPNWQLG